MASKPCRHSWPAVVASFVLLVGALLLCASAPAAAKRDTIPPTFAGIRSATTCVPGPMGGGRTASYHLDWDSAADNRTPPGQIVYDVYQASTVGGEDFAAPTYVTAAGATSLDTPPLPTGQTVYFVVRARDRAGNSDANKAERQGQNLCV
ncbi:MAG: hypothetical protein QOJ35_3105 [Solirubrobacteraceae bacterium]|jgi:hypothetical protein|nr:hypothetical protein [Solirubrobacteraceae bacterium]